MKRTLLIPSLLIAALATGSIYADNPSVERVKEDYRLTSYLFDTVAEAGMTAVMAGPEKVVPNFVDKTVSRFAYKRINGWCGITNRPHKDLVSWWLGAARQTAMTQYYQGDKAPAGLLPATIVQRIIPAFSQRTITNLMYHGVVNALGLHFPAFLLAHPYLFLLVAPLVTGIARTALNTAYDTGLSLLQNNSPLKRLPASAIAGE